MLNLNLKLSLATLFFLFCKVPNIYAQVTIGSDSPPESYITLKLDGVDGGLRLNKLTEKQRNDLSLSPVKKAEGLTIYNVTSGTIECWNGKEWLSLVGFSPTQANGLSIEAGLVQLGGKLIKDTEIALGEKNLNFSTEGGKVIFGNKSLMIDGVNDKIGINTDSPRESLDIAGNLRLQSLANGSTNDSIVVVKDGVLKRLSFTELRAIMDGDATRIVGGSVGVPFATRSGAGIRIRGSGFSVEFQSEGVFDVIPLKPFNEIFGVTCNILDSYGSGSNNVSSNHGPNFDIPGTRLRTTDNVQISWVSKEKVRIKTGDDRGNLQSRSFTFTIIGK